MLPPFAEQHRSPGIRKVTQSKRKGINTDSSPATILISLNLNLQINKAKTISPDITNKDVF